jgi:tellurite resistance protein
MLFTALKAAVLADGEISDSETKRLKKFLLADGKIDDDEKAFLKDLKASAKSTCPEFEQFYKEAVGVA